MPAFETPVLRSGTVPYGIRYQALDDFGSGWTTSNLRGGLAMKRHGCRQPVPGRHTNRLLFRLRGDGGDTLWGVRLHVLAILLLQPRVL